MKRIGKIIITAFAILTLASCENKESYIQDFSQFVQEVEDHADKYTDKDWKKPIKSLTILQAASIRNMPKNSLLKKRSKLPNAKRPIQH